MKKYIQPVMEKEMLRTSNAYMLTASEEGEIGGSGGPGDAKLRDDEEEIEEFLGPQPNGWDGGLW